MSEDGRWAAPGADGPPAGWGAPPPPPGGPSFDKAPEAAPQQYGQPQYGQPQYPQPEYGQPQYAQPEYQQQYGQPQYPPPQYGQQQYGPQPGWSDWGTAAPAPRPGVVPLRPLGVGEILDGAISAFRAHPKVMLGISAVVAAITTLISVLLAVTLLDDAGAGLSDPAVTPDSEELASIAAAFTTYTAGVLLLTGVATLILTGLVTVVVSRAVLGQSITIKEAWRATFPRLGHLLLVALLLLLAFAAIVALAVVPIVLLAMASTAAAVVAGLVLVPLAVCGTVYVWVMFSLSTPAVVLERQGALPALRRSAQLVRRSFWRTFGILLLTMVIVTTVGSILQVPFSLLASGGNILTGGTDPFGLRSQLIGGIGTILGSTITMPLSAAVTVLLYVDLRMRREGLDVELQRAAGFAAPGTSATPGVAPPPAGPGPAGPGSGTSW